jgi:NitT/TauT family transport system substrate-binding protein
MTLKPAVKFILVLLIFGAIVGGVWYSQKSGLLEKIAPKGKQAPAAMSTETKEAVKSGTPVLKVGINTWGGYAPGIYYNGGFAPSTTSRYMKEEALLVEFVLIDDFKAMRDAWKAGSIDVLGLATVDSLPTEIVSLADYKPLIVMQTDWSRGGDAVVGKHGINQPKDLIGKKVSVAIGSPSHSLLLTWLQAGGADYNQVQIVGTDSGIAAAQQFKAGAVDAAVVWSPDDQDCIKAVAGSKVIFNTKKATNVIADVFLVKQDFLNKNKETVKKFMTGWFKGAAEINTNASAKAQAASLVSANFKVDMEMSTLMIDNARLSTYGDNLGFFGLKPGGMKGEEVYNKMFRLFSAVNLAPTNIPLWRNIIDTSVLSSIALAGPGHEAEGAVPFTAPTAADSKAPAFASKSVTVTYATGSADLTEDGKTVIDMFFSNTAKEYASARVRIEGNTDNKGAYDLNKRLSSARAESVKKYLIGKYGFNPNRFVIVGNGPDRPVADNATEEGRAKNRRTDFSLI